VVNSRTAAVTTDLAVDLVDDAARCGSAGDLDPAAAMLQTIAP
jgi:hypothetical protein